MSKQREIKEKIYKAMDSFLVEAKDQNGNDRSLNQLNQDRHLFVIAMEKILADQDKISRKRMKDEQFLILNAVSAKGWSLEKYLNVESAKRELDSPTK